MTQHGSHDPATRPAGALNTFAAPARNPLLSWASSRDLCVELISRLASNDAFKRDGDLVVAGQLDDLLDTALDVHLNRFSRQRLIDTTHQFFHTYSPESFAGATVVDLGCGSLNPFSFGFLLLLLGARRAYAIDPEGIQDIARAVRALPHIAAWLILDAERLIGLPVDPAVVSRNLEGVDLRRLERGDPSGLPAERITYLRESSETLSLMDGEADLVTSVSLLEHVEEIDVTLRSLRRVTKPGGRGHHVVDFVDHRLYGNEVTHPLAFLSVESSEPLLHGSNRLRLGQMRAAFERNGFAVERVDPCRTDLVSEADRGKFVEPFRSMSLDDLSMTCARMFVRRL